MKINKLSKNFTPIHKGILFGIDSESEVPTNLLVEIIDMSTGEVIATQLLHNTVSATVNIAPYVARMNEYAPSQHQQTTIKSAPTASYKIRIGNIESEDVVISVNRCEIGDTPAIVTSFPDSRQIAHDENDELLIVASKGKRLLVDMVANRGETIHLEHLATSEAVILAISPNDFDTEVDSFDVTIHSEGVQLGTMHYTVTSPVKTATRLAWISDNGAIEQFTFPLTHGAKRSADRQILATSNGVMASQCLTKQLISVGSRYEPQATIEAIAQIASSPKVWLKQGGHWQLVEIITPHLEYNLFGKPNRLCLDICLWQKEVSL